MSKVITSIIQRLSPYDYKMMLYDPSGDYVSWEDYEILAARLQMVLDREAATCTRSDARAEARDAAARHTRPTQVTKRKKPPQV